MSHESDESKIADGDCLEAFDHLYAYLNGELKDPDAVAMIEQHLDHCRSCFSRAQVEREINARLQSAPKSEVPDSLQERLKKLIDNF
jgi:anti-sigma factor (TIGR02949 family)